MTMKSGRRGIPMQAGKFVASYFDAWNHRDPEGVASHLSGNGIYCDVPLHEQHSHDDWIESLAAFFEEHRQRYELIGEILTGRDTIAFQYRVLPEGASGNASAQGSYRGAEFMTLGHDGALAIMDHYDVPGSFEPPAIARRVSTRARQKKYAKSGLSAGLALEYKRRLEQLMCSQQLFRSPDLTLPRLAERVGCSVNHLSQVINAECGMSFFDYLNEKRVGLAREMLARADTRGSAVLDIAFEVGFNSNSAFYAAFRKRVGQTPAQYRRSRLEKTH
jgi:AraC-like DNA-binding protein